MATEVKNKVKGKIVYLHKVDGDANNNKFFKMVENIDNDTFTATWGREGAQKPQTKSFPMSQWDTKYKEKTGPRKNYTDVTEHRTITNSQVNSKGVNIIADDKYVIEIVLALQNYAKVQTAEVYKSEANGVTQKQIDDAQNFLDELAHSFQHHFGKSDWSQNMFNSILTKLYIVIPRKMKNVNDHLIDTSWDIKKIEELIEQEQSNLDAMAGQVIQQSAVNESEDTMTDAPQQTLVDMLGLKMLLVTNKAELDLVRKKSQEHAGRILKVYRVINENTQKLFEKKLSDAKDKKVDLLWHGSRNQNWWFIIQQGLKIRPSGAVHTGSMWSDGIYFASSSDKSLGYTDNGRWVSGTGTKKVYMALYSAHLGRQLVKTKHDSSCYNIDKEVKKNGYDSVWAKAGVSLRKDEYIIYNSTQCTISYLVEFSA